MQYAEITMPKNVDKRQLMAVIAGLATGAKAAGHDKAACMLLTVAGSLGSQQQEDAVHDMLHRHAEEQVARHCAKAKKLGQTLDEVEALLSRLKES